MLGEVDVGYGAVAGWFCGAFYFVADRDRLFARLLSGVLPNLHGEVDQGEHYQTV